MCSEDASVLQYRHYAQDGQRDLEGELPGPGPGPIPLPPPQHMRPPAMLHPHPHPHVPQGPYQHPSQSPTGQVPQVTVDTNYRYIFV